jgi:hypothetical protein
MRSPRCAGPIRCAGRRRPQTGERRSGRVDSLDTGVAGIHSSMQAWIVRQRGSSGPMMGARRRDASCCQGPGRPLRRVPRGRGCYRVPLAAGARSSGSPSATAGTGAFLRSLKGSEGRVRVVAEPRVVSRSTPGADWPAPGAGARSPETIRSPPGGSAPERGWPTWRKTGRSGTAGTTSSCSAGRAAARDLPTGAVPRSRAPAVGLRRQARRRQGPVRALRRSPVEERLRDGEVDCSAWNSRANSTGTGSVVVVLQSESEPDGEVGDRDGFPQQARGG